MLARLGLRPEHVKVGQEITAIGAPRHDNPNAWFLKAIILPDGTRFNALQSSEPATLTLQARQPSAASRSTS